MSGVDLGSAKVVKQYGRRLVLDLGSPFDLETQQTLLTARLNAVQSVEMDYLVNAGQDSLQVGDALVVTNASDPDVDGAAISPASQTPLWNLKDDEPYSIHAEGVWRVTNSTPNVVVAVIDTGMAELAKPMFLNLLDGYDFISDDGISIDWDGRDPDSTDPGDWGDMCPTPSWHGTKVASILAARHDNEFGMKGIASNCSVLPVRVLGLCRMGYATDVTDAIVWSAGGAINGVPANPNPAKIISLSLAGQGTCPNYLQSAVTQAMSLGSIVIAAAGNNNQNVSGYFPANCEGVIAVAASTRDGKLAAYSNWGSKIAAPGGDSVNAVMTISVNTLETGLGVTYGIGTSFAAPHVAGVAALYASIVAKRQYQENVVMQLDTHFLSFVVRANCTQEMCGRGVLSAHQLVNFTDGSIPMVNINEYGMNTHVIPSGNVPGKVLLRDPNNTYWGNGLPTKPTGQYIYSYDVRCGLGEYICAIDMFVANPINDLPGGFNYQCCDMNGNKLTTSDTRDRTGCNLNERCIGVCVYGGYCLWGYGWYSRFYLVKYTYIIVTQTLQTGGTKYIHDKYEPDSPTPVKSTCPDGMVLSGIYGTFRNYTNVYDRFENYNIDSYVMCRPLYVPCPAGHYSTGPKIDATGGAVPCPTGTYNTMTGQTTCTTCPGCGAGNYWSSPCGNSSAGTCTSCTCAAGNYWSSPCGGSSAGTCTSCICAAGNYWSSPCGGSSAGTCTSCTCAAGNYWSSPCGGSSAGTCSMCPAGKYSSTANAPSIASCTDCPAGSFSTVAGATSSSVCVGCPTDCGAGKFRQNCAVGSVGSCVSCFVCQSGYYRSLCSGISQGLCCENTNPGFYRTSCDSTSAITACPSGSYCPGTSDPIQYTITTCPAGQYLSTTPSSTTDGQCSQCPAGKFKTGASSATVCSDCAAGTYSITVGASSAIVCGNCPAGTYSATTGASSSTVCTNCPTGTYRTVSGGSSCDVCGAGTYSATTGASSATVCTSCPAGTYRTATGGSSCDACGLGTYSAATGASSATVCTTCPAGTYRTAAGGSSCNACGAGTYSATTGASLASVCTPCGVGTYSATTGASSATACTNCAAGTYRTATGASSSGDCTSCTAGKYSSTTGATLASVCTNCPAGTYRIATGASSSGDCTSCAAGKYSTTVGAAVSSTCQTCTVISFCSPTEFIKTCTASVDTYCAVCDTQSSIPADASWVGGSSSSCSWTCNIGFFRTSSNLCQLCKAPSACQIGEYVTTCTSTVDGVCTACTKKPANSYYTNKSPDTGSDACPWSCNAGYSITASSECSVSTGNTQPSTTTTAQPGTTTTAQPSTTTTAQPSTTTTAQPITTTSAQPSTTTSGQSSCSAGTYLLNGTTTCQQCPAGKYSAAEGAVGTAQCTPCRQCSAGTYSAGGNSTCTNCPAGKYSAAEGAAGTARCTPCRQCSVGTYSAAGNSTCTNCPAGKYSAAEGGVAVARCSPCSSCSAGTYSAAGDSVCTNCPAGKYSATVGATGSALCTSCLEGTYSTGGASACTTCSANTYTPSIGATSCTPCTACTAAGYYKNGCSGTSAGTCVKCTNTS